MGAWTGALAGGDAAAEGGCCTPTSGAAGATIGPGLTRAATARWRTCERRCVAPAANAVNNAARTAAAPNAAAVSCRARTTAASRAAAARRTSGWAGTTGGSQPAMRDR